MDFARTKDQFERLLALGEFGVTLPTRINEENFNDVVEDILGVFEELAAEMQGQDSLAPPNQVKLVGVADLSNASVHRRIAQKHAARERASEFTCDEREAIRALGGRI